MLQEQTLPCCRADAAVLPGQMAGRRGGPAHACRSLDRSCVLLLPLHGSRRALPGHQAQSWWCEPSPSTSRERQAGQPFQEDSMVMGMGLHLLIDLHAAWAGAVALEPTYLYSTGGLAWCLEESGVGWVEC